MGLRIVKPRTVKRFKITFMIEIPEEYRARGYKYDECDGYAEVKHIANSVYMVKLVCEDPLDTYYVVVDSPDDINVKTIKRLAEETCRDWMDCKKVLDVSEE